MDIKIAENIFKKSDFAKESDLKIKLSKELFPVKKTNLNKLMEEEGMNNRHEMKGGPGREKVRSRQKEREKAPESLGAIERDNPMIKKNKPPIM